MGKGENEWCCDFRTILKADSPILQPLLVHGSLARAGKVKSQTPKVEPAEKKKKKTGRAYNRILYNRRFVNVTTVPGAKRRMNPNPEGKSG
ncbi:hypothetical protein FRB99_005618 [Tulasnella sp. 403]|nr:hypothetical protein FRB99_005618 [Tulasnella sp. 403]